MGIYVLKSQKLLHLRGFYRHEVDRYEPISMDISDIHHHLQTLNLDVVLLAVNQ